MTTNSSNIRLNLSSPFSIPQRKKREELLETLVKLTDWHCERCEPFESVVSRMFPTRAETLEMLPFLPVRLFKTMELRSVPNDKIFKTLVSSGTTGQAVSRIFLDRETAAMQTKVLASIVTSFLGGRRLPMVVVDSAEQLADKTRFNARAAGILGFAQFGRRHHYCLDASLKLNVGELKDYLGKFPDESILIFGFTFLVWQALYEEAKQLGQRFAFGGDSVLIHGGGWKRLHDRQVDNATFKARIAETCGIKRVYNYYGMVEQVGSIFMECESGRLHAPGYAEVIIRNPISLEPLGFGESGLIQVLSVLPRSYPGHSLLTEDIGVLLGEDDCPCGRLGRTFSVIGRMPDAELRGCSDTRPLT